MSSRLDVVALLDGVVYADAFNSAATVDDVWCYSRVRCERHDAEALLAELAGPDGPVTARDGVCCLRGREALLERHGERARRAAILHTRARRVARALRWAPFVRGVVLTGSAAAGSAARKADADLLVIVAPGRIGTVFLLLGSLSRLTGRRLFCPNFYVAEDALSFEEGDLYVAREVAQAVPLWGTAAHLRRANPWIIDVFPNLQVAGVPARAAGSAAQRVFEQLLRSRIGDALEQRARKVATRRLEAHHARFGESPPHEDLAALEAGKSLRFHGVEVERGARARYAERRAELLAKLGGTARDATR